MFFGLRRPEITKVQKILRQSLAAFYIHHQLLHPYSDPDIKTIAEQLVPIARELFKDVGFLVIFTAETGLVESNAGWVKAFRSRLPGTRSNSITSVGITQQEKSLPRTN